MKIDLYTHYIKVSEIDGRGREALYHFCKSLVEFSVKQIRGSAVREAKRVYADANETRTTFKFHINSLEGLRKHLFNYGFVENHNLVIHTHEIDYAKLPKVVFTPKDTFHTPNDLQTPIINAVLTGSDYSYTVNLQTGKGKTFIALYIMMKLGLRTLINFKGGYLEQWFHVIENSFEFKDIKKDVRVIRGEKGLKQLMKEALKPNFKTSLILTTYGTLKNYFNAYKYDKDYDYPIDPPELYQKLGIGFRVTDEFHQEFYSNFLHELQTHIYRTLNLSATLDSNDPFKNKMYNLVCPKQKRLAMPYDKYIAVTSVYYTIGPKEKIRCMGSQGYSQSVFEDWIFSRKDTSEGYLELISDFVYDVYISVRESGQKLLIWAGKVDYCHAIKEKLKEDYCHLNITKYTSEDPRSNIVDFDICVSTIGSSGTALDIMDLVSVISTTAVDSRESNEQALGRLRNLKKYPTLTPKYYYFVCEQIPQHIQYDKNKREYFKDKSLSHEAYHYPKVIGKVQRSHGYQTFSF